MLTKLLRPLISIFLVVLIILRICGFHNKFTVIENQIENTEKPHSFTCRVTDYPVTDDTKVKTYAEILDTDFPCELKGWKLLVELPKSYLYEVQYGSMIKLKGAIQAPNDGLNKGNFDYRRYLEAKNTIGIFKPNEYSYFEYLGKTDGIVGHIYKFRNKIINILKKHFSGDEAGLVIAMLTGERGFISDGMNDAYKKAGIFHIVSVSGLHAGIFISVISFALLHIQMKNRRKKFLIRFTGVLVGVLLYLFTGFGISITRVILMLVIMLGAFLTRREYNILTAIVFAAMMILIVIPQEFFNQSFQLTFLSTFGLCAALKISEGKIPANTFGTYIILPLVISVGATAATLHVSVYNFCMIPVMGIVTNLIAVPLSSFLLCAVVVFSLAAPLLPRCVADIAALSVYIPAKLTNELSVTMAKLEFSCINVMPGSFFVGSTILICTSAVIYLLVKKKKATGIIALIFTIVFSSIMMYNNSIGKTEIIYVNAGKGEATVIRSADGSITMIDCGSRSFYNSAGNVFMPCFNHLGINKADKLLISYFDDEHTNAVTTLMRDGFVKELILPPETDVSEEKTIFNRRKIIDAAGKYGVTCNSINYGETIYAAEDVKIYLYGENAKLTNKNACAIYKIICGETSFLSGSCLGAKGQELYSETDTDCSVLKIPNYGQTVKGTEKYILSAKPEYAVVTIPQNDRYIKFDKKLEKILKENKIPYARTDKNKTVTFTTDGKRITSVKLGKGELN